MLAILLLRLIIVKLWNINFLLFNYLETFENRNFNLILYNEFHF